MVACKTKQPAASGAKTAATTSTETKTTTDAAAPQTKGKVSHQYRATGCPTVVIVKNGESVMTLIPSVPLPEKMDVDGLEILFDFLPLRMHNPEGCNVGIPAGLTNIKTTK